MAQLLIVCPNTERLVYTGIEESPNAAAAQTLVNCPACGANHGWTLDEARPFVSVGRHQDSTTSRSVIGVSIRRRLINHLVNELGGDVDPSFTLEMHGIDHRADPSDQYWESPARFALAEVDDATLLELASDLLLDSKEGSQSLQDAVKAFGEIPEATNRLAIRSASRSALLELKGVQTDLAGLTAELKRQADGDAANKSELDRQIWLLEEVVQPAAERIASALKSIETSIAYKDFLKAVAELQANEGVLRRVLKSIANPKVKDALENILAMLKIGAATLG